MGAPLGAVFLRNIIPGTSFDVFPYITLDQLGAVTAVQIVKIGDKEINNLEDLAVLMPTLIKKRYFTVDFKSYLPYQGFSYWPISSRATMQSEVQYYDYGSHPVMMTYDKTSLEWKEMVLVEKAGPQ